QTTDFAHGGGLTTIGRALATTHRDTWFLDSRTTNVRSTCGGCCSVSERENERVHGIRRRLADYEDGSLFLHMSENPGRGAGETGARLSRTNPSECIG